MTLNSFETLYGHIWSDDEDDFMEGREVPTVTLQLRNHQLTTVPSGVYYNSLILDECHQLQELPEDLEILGSCRLTGCTHLSHLPERIAVGDDLDLSYSSVKEFPAVHSLDGNVTAEHAALTSIATLENVSGHLRLAHCESLEEMPERLKVNGDLDLSYCTNLKQLPQELIVRGNLYLQQTLVTSLPEHLLVGGDIFLQSDVRVTPNGELKGNGHFVCYNKQLWRILFQKDAFYIVEDLQFSAAHGGAYVLYKTVDGEFTLEPVSSVISDSFYENWFGKLF